MTAESEDVISDPPRAALGITLGDLQSVLRGTGNELWWIMKKEFASVGIPDWEARVEATAGNPGRLTVYLVGTDKGPYNVKCTRLICLKLAVAPNVTIDTVWCMFHQFHLIFSLLYDVLDDWCQVKPIPIDRVRPALYSDGIGAYGTLAASL